ncbi:MAG: sigma-54 dependent transcriptional regulator [Deltaproteobacteria bacterium]
MVKSPFNVLIVDDDAAVRQVLCGLLSQAGMSVCEASSAREAELQLEQSAVDVVVSDVRMPGMDGLALLRRIRQHWPEIGVVMLTAHGTIQLAVEAMKSGADEFMLKPFDREEVLFVVRKVGEHSRRAGNLPPRASIAADAATPFVAKSTAMEELGELIRRAASGAATVLIRGETGTGKELVARAIHEQSARRAKPFIKLNCAALPDSLLESELFGYEPGAFTGAARLKPGRVELAHGGTLFLDEIGDVPLSTQVKLLRILQERELERVGGVKTIKVDVRFVAATHRDLEARVLTGEFRQDLFFRLNVLPLRVPPLRERLADVRPLTEQFIRAACAANGKAALALAPAAMQLLEAQSWPGNVRELEHFVERLVVFSDEAWISQRDVERELTRGSPAQAAEAPAGRLDLARSEDAPAETGGLDEHRRNAEREAVLQALSRAGNKRTVAARLLGVSRRTLYNKLEELGIS